MGLLTNIFTNSARLATPARTNRNVIRVSKRLAESAHAEPNTVLEQLNTSTHGLTVAEIEARLKQYGANEVAREKHLTILARLWDNLKNPLVILLSVLAIVSYLSEDLRSATG